MDLAELKIINKKLDSIEKKAIALIKENFELKNTIKLCEAVIPEGYRTAKDTLPEQVALMAAGLKAYSAERAELLKELAQRENEF